MDFKVRGGRGVPQGRKKLVRERAEYFRLVDQGYGNKEASRRVGVNERTGRVWRNGRPVGRVMRSRPPAREALVAGTSSRFLSEGERIVIADRRRAGMSVRTIAAGLGRSPSTVSRELRRNAHPGSGDYRPHAAQARADARRPRPKGGKIAACAELREVVQSWLGLEMEPGADQP